MNLNSSTFCRLSHVGMALQNNADFCSCNVNKLSWKNNQHQVLNIYEHPIRDSFQSYTRKMIAAALDHNQRHPSCQHCWDQEDAGVLSIRQQYNQIFQHVEPDSNQPKVLIFKPGNTCNMACRMCNPATSSSWYVDGHKLYGLGTSFKDYTKQFEIIRNSYEPTNSVLWNDLKQWMEKLEVIDIYGGEPFLMSGLFDMLKHGVDIGSATRISIQINTNASFMNQKYIDILKNYKSVVFKVSADSDIASQFEYIRHKSNYNTVMQNIAEFKNQLAHLPNFKLFCVLTITSLNVFYTDEIKNNLQKKLGIPVGTNMVWSPGEYDIRHLPIPVKNMLMLKIKDQSVKSTLQQQIPGCEIEWPKFCQITDQLDHIRQQSFRNTFPEWWNILEHHWVYG